MTRFASFAGDVFAIDTEAFTATKLAVQTHQESGQTRAMVDGENVPVIASKRPTVFYLDSSLVFEGNLYAVVEAPKPAKRSRKAK